MTNKKYLNLLYSISIIPIIIVCITISSIPSESIIAFNYFDLKLNVYYTKVLLIATAIIPLVYNIFLCNKEIKPNEINLFKAVCFIKVLYMTICILLLYFDLFNIISYGLNCVILMIGLFKFIICFASKTFAQNSVIGFNNNFILNNYMYRKVNDLFCITTFVIACVLIVVSLLFIITYKLFIAFIILVMLNYILTYFYSIHIYKEEKNV